MEDCIAKWVQYMECVDKYNPESNFCQPYLKEYNNCVYRNEQTHVIKKPKIIEKQPSPRFNASYWNYENSYIWWSL